MIRGSGLPTIILRHEWAPIALLPACRRSASRILYTRLINHITCPQKAIGTEVRDTCYMTGGSFNITICSRLRFLICRPGHYHRGFHLNHTWLLLPRIAALSNNTAGAKFRYCLAKGYTQSWLNHIHGLERCELLSRASIPLIGQPCLPPDHIDRRLVV